VEGEKDMKMNAAISSLGASSSAASRAVQLGFAALLGVFIVGFAGFSQMDAVHNAAHDYRHSMAFPCH
jgi:cobalt transporter subunit CbtB